MVTTFYLDPWGFAPAAPTPTLAPLDFARRALSVSKGGTHAPLPPPLKLRRGSPKRLRREGGRSGGRACGAPSPLSGSLSNDYKGVVRAA